MSRKPRVKKQTTRRNKNKKELGGSRFLEARHRGGQFGGGEKVGPLPGICEMVGGSGRMLPRKM